MSDIQRIIKTVILSPVENAATEPATTSTTVERVRSNNTEFEIPGDYFIALIYCNVPTVIKCINSTHISTFSVRLQGFEIIFFITSFSFVILSSI